MTRILGVDPGYTQSAYVLTDGTRLLAHDLIDNDVLLTRLEAMKDEPSARDGTTILVVEQMAAMGMAVGAEVLETCWWSGRFVEMWAPRRWDRLKRVHIKRQLCGVTNAKDANVRQALIDRFGPSKDAAIGRKAQPGPLYGIASHEWAALATATAYLELHALTAAS